MTISVSALGILVVAALVASAVAPALLLVFLVRDWKNGELW